MSVGAVAMRPLHHHRGCQCTVASPTEAAARGPIKREICPGQDPRQTNEQTILALEFTAERAHPKSGSLCTDLNSVCYNPVTEHGQMLGVAIACGRFLAV